MRKKRREGRGRVEEESRPSRLWIPETTGEMRMPEEEEKKKAEHEPEEEWKVKFKDGTVFAPVTYSNLVEWYQEQPGGAVGPLQGDRRV
jgi:hypothetical protein